MLKSLWEESFGNLNAGIAESQAEEPGILSILANSIGAEVFGGVAPDGRAYTTFETSGETDVITSAKPKNASQTNPLAVQPKQEVKPNGKPGTLSAPEQALSETEKLIGAIVTNILSPFLMPFDALAIKADLVPTPDELISPTLKDLATAALAYHQIPGIVAADPQRQRIITEAASTALKIAIPQPDADVTWEKPTTIEKETAIEQAYNIVRNAIAEIGDTKCQSCVQLPCKCGANEFDFTMADILERVKSLTEEHNSQLALEAASTTIVNNVRRQAAGAIQAAMGNKTIEILHIPPKSLLTGAVLGDWKQIIPALVASVIENESGKRGASISIRPKPGSKDGGSLVVNMTEMGKGTDSDEFPLNAQTVWQQSTLQQSLSDKPKNRKRWGKTNHATVPEIGNLNIISPDNAAVKQTIPLAVRFPNSEKDDQGGASIINRALVSLTGVQAFLKDAQSALTTPDFGSDNHALTQSATVAATESLEKSGMRPGVIARKTHEIVTKILEDTDSNPTLHNIAQQVHLAKHEEAAANSKTDRERTVLNLSLTNLQAGLTHELILRQPKKYLIHFSEQYHVRGEPRTATRQVYVLDRETNKPVPAENVNRLINRKLPQPPSWEAHELPSQEMNKDIIQAAISTLASISPTPQLWRQIIDGQVEIPDHIERSTISKAMLAINSDATKNPAGPNRAKHTFSQRAADNIDLLVALLTPRKKSK